MVRNYGRIHEDLLTTHLEQKKASRQIRVLRQPCVYAFNTSNKTGLANFLFVLTLSLID